MAAAPALRPHAAGPLTLGHMLMAAAAVLTGAAGVVHLSTAGKHLDHPFVAGAFVAMGIVQLVVAGAMALRPARALLLASVGANAAIVVVWAVTRVTGVGWVDGLEQAQTVGAEDLIATGLEVLAVAASVLLLAVPATARETVIPSARRLLAGMAAMTLVLVAVGVIAPHDHGGHLHAAGASHEHVGDDGHGDGHGDAHQDRSGGHGHGAEGHGPSTPTAAHGHAPGATHAVHAATPGHAAGGHVSGGHAGGTHRAGAHGEVAHAPGGHEHSEPAQARPAAANVSTVGKTATVRYGPFFLPPADMGGEGHYNRVLTELPRPCTDCYLIVMEPDLVYDDGREANLDTGVMLHHSVLFRPSRNDPTCGRSGVGFIGERFFAAGNERTGGWLPPGFGYHVGNDNWSGLFEIMNHANTPKSVWFTMTVRYLPTGESDLKPVKPLWLDMDNCGDSEYHVPAGPSHEHWQWRSNVTGRIVGAGGHVHDGGLRTELTNHTTGEHVCTSVAGYSPKGNVDSMSTCTWDRLGTVRSGEVLELHSLYNGANADPGAMGIMLVFLYETDDLTGGSPAPPEAKSPPSSDGPAPTHGGHPH